MSRKSCYTKAEVLAMPDSQFFIKDFEKAGFPYSDTENYWSTIEAPDATDAEKTTYEVLDMLVCDVTINGEIKPDLTVVKEYSSEYGEESYTLLKVGPGYLDELMDTDIPFEPYWIIKVAIPGMVDYVVIGK